MELSFCLLYLLFIILIDILMGCCQSVPEGGAGKKTPLPPESVKLAGSSKTTQVVPHLTKDNETVTRGPGQGSPNKVLPMNGRM